ncbi:MAG: hypothetical protein PHH67_06120 [Methanosarcina sp.]|nr:hypothetical protein [Methanosarcina sp.]
MTVSKTGTSASPARLRVIGAITMRFGSVRSPIRYCEKRSTSPVMMIVSFKPSWLPDRASPISRVVQTFLD